MLFRHHTDTPITPDTLFEAKGPFEDSRIFKILEISGIFSRKSYSNENQWIFNRKSMVFHENPAKANIEFHTHHELICPVSDRKSLRIIKILFYLCFLDIVPTLPSLPTHCSRRKVRFKTRGFSKFWKFRYFL